jgi:hypothetical protein
MLMLYENPAMFANTSADEMQRIIGRYVAWRKQLAAEGKFAGGNKLSDAPGRVVARADGRVLVRDGPFVEVKEVIGGYFLISAADYDDAVAISRDCPHLDFGGTIEIRQIDPT